MNVILIYDSESNSGKFNRICKKYLTWVQNSCFEGSITETNLKLLKSELKKIKVSDDCIIIYEKIVSYNKYIIGKEKNKITNLL